MTKDKMIMNNSLYALSDDKTIKDLAFNVKHFLMNSENMEAQILSLENGSYVIQGRTRHSTLKSLAGMNKVITIKLTPVGDRNVLVEIGKGKWLDKIVGASIGYFLWLPILVTTVIGAYKQGSLPGKVAKVIEVYCA